MSTAADPRRAGRTLGALAAVIVLAAAVLVVSPFLVAGGHDHIAGEIDSLETLVRVVTIPAALFTIAVLIGVAAFGSWRRIWFDDRPAASWVRGVAMALVVAAAVAIDYGDLADAGLGTTLMILLTSALLSTGWELLFRGLAVDVLRHRGLDDVGVVTVSSAVYGTVHLLTVVTHGPDTVVHIVVMALLGPAFYALRRVSGSLVAKRPLECG